MASDIERSHWPSPPEGPSARLCNFPTGKSAPLRLIHQEWLRRHIVPILRKPNRCLVEIAGLASKLGSAALNEKLSQARADEVKSFLENELQMSLPNVITASYGESISTGAPDDNDGYWRAVIVKLHPGVVTLPPPPPQVVRKVPPKPAKTGPTLYFGIGVKFGGILAVVGTQAVEGYMFSVDDYNDQAHFEAEIITAGVGLGGGINVVFVMAYGASKKSQYIGAEFDGWDFAISLGGRWGDALKAVKRLPALARIAKLIKSSGKATQALKLATKLSPQEWEKVAELIKASREALGVDPNATTPQVAAFDIPLAGAALEVSLYKWWGEITAFN